MEFSISYLSRLVTVLAVFVSTSSTYPVSDDTSRLLAALFEDGQIEEQREVRSKSYVEEERLFCATGSYLEIRNDGGVQGTVTRDLNSVVEISSVGVGLVSIRNPETGLYLAIDSDGDVYTSDIGPYACRECVFKESLLLNWYHSYESYYYSLPGPDNNKGRHFYLSIDRRGHVKTMPHTSRRMSHFIPVSLDADAA
ncbi:fibroblast growth factor 9-like [Saccoglossus kowalevskii]|uniref:Fibroblast growth factor n=1 Tax=Saccoglossus kowalevskii TaxID=10224 RepID=A0A0U2M0Y6_SACKO|nr:fibroblast growth factor 20b-like mw [Saccoglossus kowalevskii]